MRTFRHTSSSNVESPRRGAVMVFMVAGIVMLLAMVMISVDVASMQLARTELRAATDAAAKAGAESLLRTQDKTKAVDAALAFAQLNNVGGKAFKLKSTDVVIGTSTVQSDGSWAFASGGTKPNAVRINSLMNGGSASGPVTLAFGKVFNTGNFAPSRTSTASAMVQEVALVLDRSGSMAWDLSGEDDNYPPGGEDDRRPKKGSRWMALEDSVEIYLQEVLNTPVPSRVGLVTWAQDVYDVDDEDTGGSYYDDNDDGDGDSDLLDGLADLLLPALPYVKARKDYGLTTSFSEVRKTLKQRGNHPIYGKTNMAAGIDKGVEMLTAADVKPYAQKTMVLMTDGEWNEGRHPVDAAEDARDKGITIHVVTFLPGAKAVPGTKAWDAQTVATTTGGLYIHANNATELTAAFRKIARTLPVVLTD
jgi:Ca-activated chloride channel homolog